jgi:hypothetical protein
MNGMDSETITRLRDEAIGEELRRRYHTEEQIPARALFEVIELGASESMLAGLGALFVDLSYSEIDGVRYINQGVRLRYVPELLAAGYGVAEVRALFERLALIRDDWTDHMRHREGLWNDEESAQILYGEAPEALRDFARQVGAVDGYQIMRHHAALAKLLGNRELFEEVMAEVVRNPGVIDNEEQFRLIVSLPIPMRIEAAARVNSLHPWSLVLKGYVLARYNARGRDGRRQFEHIREEMRRAFYLDRPERTPARWRWLAEGFRRGFRPPEPVGGEPSLVTWRHIMDFDSELQLALRMAGVEFLKVKPVPVPAGRALQVTIKTPKGPVILRHNPNGPRGEQLAPGDTVIVTPALVADKRPDFRLGGRPVFLLELHKADVPVQAMFADRKLATR